MGLSTGAMELPVGGMVLRAGLMELADGGRARYDGETELYAAWSLAFAATLRAPIARRKCGWRTVKGHRPSAGT